MPAIKKFLSNIKFGKDRESTGPEPSTLSNLRRSNARVFKKRNESHESIDAVEPVEYGIQVGQSTATIHKRAPKYFKESSRRYSFEPGASVENFEAELEAHSKHLQKRPKRQNTNDSLGSNVPMSKFGLRINNANFAALGLKAASTLDLRTEQSQNVPTGTKQSVHGRYGLTVHPDNIRQSVVKGGCWEFIPTPPLSSPSWISIPGPSSLKAKDPFEEAQLASDKWSRAASFEERLVSRKVGKVSDHDSEEESPVGEREVLSMNERLEGGNPRGVAIDGVADDHIKCGSPADSAISLEVASPEVQSSVQRGVAELSSKGKQRQSKESDERASRTMPGSFPVEQRDSSETAQWQRLRASLEEYHSPWPVWPTPTIQTEEFRAQICRICQLDQERKDREQASQLQAELKKQQEEADRIAAEEANRLAAEEAARLAAEEEARQSLRECVACADSKDTFDFPAKPPTESCDHDVHTCVDCLQSWMASEFETKGGGDIKCPECTKTLQYSDVQTAASKETFQAYDKLVTRNALGALEEFAWCLGPNCGSGQLNIGNNNFMSCKHCGYRQCLKHKVAWHKGETCKQYDYRTSGQQARDEERATEKMIDKVSKKCPGKSCGARIQKTDGCDHMTCKACKHQFCWQCMAAQTEIKRVGNTAHAKSCKFHSTNLDIAYPFNAH